MKKKIYIAYGSNMSMEQMATRCPEATLLGYGIIKDYELLFKGSKTGSYATIEKKKGAKVPVWVWSISERDERNLDRYEGCPRFYYKRSIEVYTEEGTTEGLVYIMHEEREHGVPSMAYYKVLYDGYIFAGFNLSILRRGYIKSYEATMQKHRDELFY